MYRVYCINKLDYTIILCNKWIKIRQFKIKTLKMYLLLNNI